MENDKVKKALELVFVVFMRHSKPLDKVEMEKFNEALRLIRDEDPFLYTLEVEPELIQYISRKVKK